MRDDGFFRSGPVRALVTLAALALVVGCLYWAQKVLIPLVLAVLIAFILTPLVVLLQRARLGRVPAALVTVLLAAVVLGGIGWVVAGQVRDLAQELPKHRSRIADKVAQVRAAGGSSLANLWDLVRDVGRQWQEPGPEVPSRPPGEPVPVVVQAEQPPGLERFSVMVGPVFEGLATAALVFVLVVFILINREDMRDRIIRLAGPTRVTSTTRVFNDAAERVSRFLGMQVMVNAGFGLLLAGGLALVGVPYAALWGLLGGLMRFIPYLGIWVVAALLVVFSLAVAPGWVQPLVGIALFVVLELTAANVVEPLLFGHGTGVSPVALLAAAAFWTWLWGPLGLLLSTPMTVCLAVLGQYVADLEFFWILLGDRARLETDVGYYQRLLARDQDEAVDLVEEYVRENEPETVFDEVLLPALVMARRDRDDDGLPPEEEARVLQVTRQLVEDVALPGVAGRAAGARPCRVLGCPGQDEADEAALEMFGRLLEAAGCNMEVLTAHTLAGELVARVAEDRIGLVVLAALPPGGLAQARYLCKRLKAQHPDVKVLVGRWGQADNLEATRQRLVAAGADFVAGTLLEARAQAVPLIQVLAAAPAAAEAVPQPA